MERKITAPITIAAMAIFVLIISPMHCSRGESHQFNFDNTTTTTTSTNSRILVPMESENTRQSTMNNTSEEKIHVRRSLIVAVDIVCQCFVCVPRSCNCPFCSYQLCCL
ncbi:hypothetical protein P3L10_000848 [Capsicum annuum]